MLRDTAKRILKTGLQPSNPQDLVLEILRILSLFQKKFLQTDYENLEIELGKTGEGRHFRRIIYAEFMDQLESSITECIILLGGSDFWSKKEDIINSRGALQSVCNYITSSKNILENMLRGVSTKKSIPKYTTNTILESALSKSYEYRYATQEDHKQKIEILMKTLVPGIDTSKNLVGENNRILQKQKNTGILSISEQSKKFYARELKYIHPGSLKTTSTFYIDFFQIFTKKIPGFV